MISDRSSYVVRSLFKHGKHAHIIQEPLREYLDVLEKQHGVTVYRYTKKLQHWKELDPMINSAVQKWYEENKSRKDLSRFFVVTGTCFLLLLLRIYHVFQSENFF